VADVRAPTPTGAAEFCVPVRLDLVASLADLDRRRARAATRFFGERGRDLRALARALPRGEDLLAPLRQRLDRTEEQLAVRIRRAAQDRRVRIGRAAATLARHSPQAELARRRERLRAQGDRLDANRRATFEAIRTHRPAAIEALRGRLETAARRVPASLGLRAAHAFRLVKSFSYKDVLARGYVLARDAGGRPIRSAASVAPGARLTLSFADGDVAAQAEPPARRKAGTKAAEREQGALF
jgi:exodeoxyribonuclease VII large subunit